MKFVKIIWHGEVINKQKASHSVEVDEYMSGQL